MQQPSCLRCGLESTRPSTESRSVEVERRRQAAFCSIVRVSPRSFVRRRLLSVHVASSFGVDSQNGVMVSKTDFSRNQAARLVFPVMAKALANGDVKRPVDLFCAMDGLRMISTVGHCNELLFQLRKVHAVEAMIEFLKYMKQRKMELSGTSYTLIISACGIESDLERASLYFDQLKNSSDIPITVHSYLAMLNACLRCDDVERAQSYFDEMLKAGMEMDALAFVPVFRKLGYKKQQRSKAADMCTAIIHEMERQGVKLTHEIYCSALWTYSHAGYVESLAALYKTARELGMKFDLETYNGVLFGLSQKSEHLEKIVQIFADMKNDGIHPTIHTYHLMMRGCAAAGDEVRCLALLEELEEAGFTPTLITYNSILPAFRKTYPEDKKAQMWHSIDDFVSKMKNRGSMPDTTFYRTVLGVCVLNCSRDRAERYLPEMKENGVPLSNRIFVKLIKLEAQCDREGDETAAADRISALFERMDEEGLQLDRPCCIDLMRGFLSSKSTEKIQPFVEKMQQADIRYDSLLLKQLLEFWFTVGDEEMASKVIEEALGQGLSRIYVDANLLEVLVDLNKISAVIEQLQRMKDDGSIFDTTHMREVSNKLEQASLSEEDRGQISAVLESEQLVQES